MKGGIGFAVALVAIHVFMSFPYPWESLSFFEACARINPDLVVLAVVATVSALSFGPRALVTHVVTLCVLFVPLYRFGVTILPVYFGKEFDLADDVLMVPGLVHLLTHELSGWQQVAAPIVAVGLVAVLYWLLYRLVRYLSAPMRRDGFAYAFLGLAQLLVIAGAVDRAVVARPGVMQTRQSMFARALVDSSSWVSVARLRTRFAARLREARARVENLPSKVALPERADLYVMFVESYGPALFQMEGNGFRDPLGRFEAMLEEGGYRACSALIAPSIRGGNSSLAHAEFVCGMKVETRRVFRLLLDSSLIPLPRRLADSGYRTVHVLPAMPEPWPASSSFFGFERDLFQRQLAYDGRQYHWGKMPDQFALARVLDLEVRRAQRPLFVQYVSVTSHSPFRTIPRYSTDWRVAADAKFYDTAATEYGIDWVGFATDPKVADAYLESIVYSLRTIFGFAGQLSRPSLLLVLGDHQPPHVKSLGGHENPWDVPIHAIANRPELLDPFRRRGFAPGLTPDLSQRSFRSAQFLPRFLEDFGQR